MLEKIKKDFTTMTWVLIPVAIAINIAIGQIVVLLKLPVFLDSIGTVLVAITLRSVGRCADRRSLKYHLGII